VTVQTLGWALSNETGKPLGNVSPVFKRISFFVVMSEGVIATLKTFRLKRRKQ
jgi:hypothetical protein